MLNDNIIYHHRIKTVIKTGTYVTYSNTLHKGQKKNKHKDLYNRVREILSFLNIKEVSINGDSPVQSKITNC